MTSRRTRSYLCGLLIVGVLAVIGVLLLHRSKSAPSAPTSANSTAHPATATPATKGSYVALGDSVAAGLGLPTTADSVACGRNQEAYPYAVAQARQLRLTEIACSGATVTSGILGPQNAEGETESPQIDRALAAHPNLVSLTIGANDIGWTQFLTECYRGTCGTAADDALLATRLASLQTSINTVLDKLASLQPAPRVVVTGYYAVFPGSAPATDCSDLTGITAGEISWWNSAGNRLNGELMAAVAAHPNARFAPVDFSGHELCSADPWIQPLLSLAPYHPTTAGQAAIARAVTSASR